MLGSHDISVLTQYNKDMKQIAFIDQHKLELTSPHDQELTWTRHAARAVLRDGDNRVAIMHFTVNGSYKLPGGGIDEGEDTETALRREVREEAGYTITDIKELGVVEENRYFNGMHQLSYCFTALAVDFVGTQLTEKEAAGGMELVWFDDIEAAIAAIESAHVTDEDGSEIGLEMMKRRDIAILRASA